MSLFSVDEYGVITMDSADILEDFQEAYKKAIGSELNLDAGTPQGQMMANDTMFLQYAQEQTLLALNSFAIRTAEGKALDIAAQDWGYYRKQGVATVVLATLTGSAGTVIPAGALASNGENQFQCLNTTTIPASGSVNAQFACTVTGAAPCVSGTLNTIVTTISGWDTINNNTDGILGYDTESDNTFRQRITANWLNVRATAILGAIIDNVAALDGVISVVGRENYTNITQTIDGVSMPAHSIYLCVLGGNGSDIAQTLLNKKTLGCATVGNTQVSYYNSQLGISYTYNIQTPSPVNLKVNIEYTKNYYTPANVEQNAIDVIMDYISQNPFMIGQTVSGNELAMALKDFNQFNLLSFKVALENDANYSDYVLTSIQQIPVLASGNISFTEISNG